MADNEVESYVSALELAEPKYEIVNVMHTVKGTASAKGKHSKISFGGGFPSKPLPPTYDEFDAYVDHSSIVTFDKEISMQYKKDVLNSQLLAQLAADKIAKRETYEWYKKYQEVLTRIGWKNKEF
jgi:hypothetical protein